MNHEFPMRSIFPPSVFPQRQFPTRPSPNRTLVGWEDGAPESFGTLQRQNQTTPSYSNAQHGLRAPSYPPSSGLIRPPYYSAQSATSQSPAQQFYSRERTHKERNTRSHNERYYGPEGNHERDYKSDTAMAYAVKTARYPILYEKMKAPVAAKRALKEWREGAGVAALDEDRSVPTLGCSNQPRIEGTSEREDGEPNAAGEGATRQSTDDSTQSGGVTGESNCRRQTDDSGGTSGTGSGDGNLTQPTPSSSLAVNRRTMPTTQLPPQNMSFSGPILEKTKRGNRMVLTCTLAKSYPNFHLECEYTYVDKSERTNSSQIDTRFSFATITTRENVWVVAFEKRGYNEAFIKAMVGEDEYGRLESSGGPVKGHPKGTEVAAGVGKKVDIPAEFDLGGVSCAADGFYKMKIFVPASTCRKDDW